MKAAQINDYGDSWVIQINEVDKPAVSNGQVLIKVYAASLNPFDSALRSGYMKNTIRLNFPATLGGDIAGIIIEVGDGVADFGVGDNVYGQANVVAGSSGALAEYAATAAGQVAKSPVGLDFKQAASLPLAGVSALQAVKSLNLQRGQKIFIHGGSGGIGIIAIQIAKNIGAYVATTATGGNIDLVKNLGADEVIDYKSQDFVRVLNNYDAVLDNVGGLEFDKTFQVLKTGGKVISMAGQVDQAKATEFGVTATAQSTKVTTEVLNELRELVEKGIVNPHIDKAFPLDQIREAFKARETGSIKGKVVIEIK